MISDRVEELSQQVFAMVDTLEFKMKRNPTCDISSSGFRHMFCDPECMYEKRYASSKKKKEASNLAAKEGVLFFVQKIVNDLILLDFCVHFLAVDGPT